MKASELGAKVGDYIARGRDIVAHKVFESNGELMAAVTKIAHLTGDDWQLLQPRPELGEPVAWAVLEVGDSVLVLTPDSRLIPGLVDGGKNVVFGSSGYRLDQIHSGNTSYKVYRDPRPLPALPNREPTPKEKCEEILVRNGFGGKSPNFKGAINELAALVENHDE